MLIRSLILFALYLNACKQNESSNPPNKNGANSGAATSTSLVGTWSTSCVPSDTIGKYKRAIVTFSATTVSGTAQEFGDSSCTTAAGINTTMSYSYTLGQSIASIPGAKSLDMVPMSVTITVNDQATADLYNSNKACGRANWVKGAIQDFMGCRDQSGNPIVSTNFDLIQMTGNTMTMGKNDDTYDGTTAAKRPITLDTVLVYTRISK